MTKPAAKKSDQIVSVTPGDVHIIMIPSPGGPIPTPIPHPCASMIKDKVAKKVKVMGQPGATKGSKSKHTPPHIPQGGPFQKPPGNKGEVMTGSSSVKYQGKDATMLGETGKMCSDPSDTPVGKVIGTAAMVLVGGGSGSGDADRAKASADAMKAASAHCHKWINDNMPEGADREQAHRDVCTATGHPVDVATGKMFTRRVELSLPGRIPLELVRNYSSARSDRGGFGASWRHSYELELVAHPDFVAFRDGNGRFLELESVAAGEESVNPSTGLRLTRSEEEYRLETPLGRRFHFPIEGAPPKSGTRLPLCRISDPFGNEITLRHDSGRLRQIIDTAGRIVQLDYDEGGRISRLGIRPNRGSGELQTVQTYEYSDDGMLIAARDALGHACRYEYQRHLLVRETDRNGFSFYFTYDEEGWCRETWGDGGLLFRRLEYDRQRQRTRVVDSLGHQTLFEWNELGLVESESDPRGNEWVTEHDTLQRPVFRSDPESGTWSYGYDDFGALASRVDPLGNEVGIERDELGRRVAVVDGEGQTWRSLYDQRGLLAADVDPLGQEETYEWSELGELIAVTDRLGRRMPLERDEAGNVVARTSAHGSRVTRRTDALGRLLVESDGHGERLRLEYDVLGRVTSEWRRGRGEVGYAHDPEGNIVEVRGADGRVTRFEYGRFNKLLRRERDTSAAGESLATELRYDSENRLVSILYPGGGEAAYGYDPDGRVAWKRSVDGRTLRFDRDAAGHVIAVRDEKGILLETDRDGLGRLIRRKDREGRETTYDYDALGRLTAATNEHGTIEFEYDAAGNVVSESSPDGAASWTYDAGGRPTESSFRDDLTVTYAREGERLEVGHNGSSVELAFNAHGRLAEWTMPNGLSETREYEGCRRPRHVRRGELELRYEYDAEERIERIVASDGRVTRFERDALGRLVSSEQTGGDESLSSRFAYDARGNRYREDSGFQYDAERRVYRTNDLALEYDDAGRLLSWVDAAGQRTRFTWDSQGTLESVDVAGRNVRFRYDALGRRIAKVVDGGETRFAWEGCRLSHEWRPGGEERHYVYRPDSFEPLICYRRIDGGEWQPLYFQNDHRGCPEALLDAEGRTVWSARRDPFGEVAAEAGELDQPIGLPGQYRDAETGLVYNWHRYYSPALTMYLSPDPLGQLGGENLYAYAADPVMQIDPTGLSADDYDQSQRTPHRIVEINGVKYVEFDAMHGFTSGSNINVGGSGVGAEGSPDSMASIGPNGEVVVQEGRHRAVSAAAGDPIPEHLGGIPDRPGHLRYPLGENGDFETTDNVGPSLFDLASDPDKLDAARSGHPSRRTT